MASESVYGTPTRKRENAQNSKPKRVESPVSRSSIDFLVIVKHPEVKRVKSFERMAAPRQIKGCLARRINSVRKPIMTDSEKYREGTLKESSEEGFEIDPETWH